MNAWRPRSPLPGPRLKSARPSGGLILLSPRLPHSCLPVRGDGGSMAGAADRLRRPAGPPIDWPHSSSKTIQPPRAAAVLYPRPGLFLPHLHRAVITLDGPPRAQLAGPAAPLQRVPDPRDGVPHPELPGDQVADAGQRPPLVFPPGRQRPGRQRPGLQRQIQRPASCCSSSRHCAACPREASPASTPPPRSPTGSASASSPPNWTPPTPRVTPDGRRGPRPSADGRSRSCVGRVASAAGCAAPTMATWLHRVARLPGWWRERRRPAPGEGFPVRSDGGRLSPLPDEAA